MNGVEERYEIKLKQTSKGIWYCDGLTVANKDEVKMMHFADELMTGIEKTLEGHNKEAE